jgi:hypothetical protein
MQQQIEHLRLDVHGLTGAAQLLAPQVDLVSGEDKVQACSPSPLVIGRPISTPSR